jgi:predicted DNA-binding transcriptional regulator AlpA
MTTYVFSIVVEGLDLDSDPQNAYLESLEFDVLASRTAGVTYLEVEVECARPSLALDTAKKALEVAGIKVLRVDLDLVTITEIAERLDVNRETVRLWSSGQRRDDFPLPYSTVGKSSVWAWADVFAWLCARGQSIPSTYSDNPLPLDVTIRVNGGLAAGRQAAQQWGVSSATVVKGMPWSKREPRRIGDYKLHPVGRVS